MKVRPLTTNEQAANPGLTHIATITADDLTVTATNTLQTLTICKLKAGDMITRALWRAKTFFKNSADPAFNTDTFSVGDDSAVNTHIAAAEVNANGTTVAQGVSNTLVHYTAANNLKVTFNSQSGKKLSDINTGELELMFGLLRPAILEQAVNAGQITTK